MATEEGIVIKTGTNTAWVKTTRSSACKSCSARKGCTSSGATNMEVEALNSANARVGDRIVLQMETGSLLKASFLLYIFPILCMLVGAVAAEAVADALGFSSSAMTPVIALVCFVGAFLFVKVKGNRMAEQDSYRPVIVRVLPHQP